MPEGYAEINTIEEAKEYAEHIILYAQAQHMPVVEAKMIVGEKLSIDTANDIVINTLADSILIHEYSISSNFRPSSSHVNFKELLITITRK